MKVKNILGGLIIAVLGMSTSAWAGGKYDAIYQAKNNPNTYALVHSNGGTMIISLYTSIANNATTRFVSSAGSIEPTKLDMWEVYDGSIVENLVFISGVNYFGGCKTVNKVIFSETGAISTIVTTQETVAGFNAGLNCRNVYPVGSITEFVRVF